MNKKLYTESGRSMVEMLGVLAIIGVLSVGGIAGYKTAIETIRINHVKSFAESFMVSYEAEKNNPDSLYNFVPTNYEEKMELNQYFCDTYGGASFCAEGSRSTTEAQMLVDSKSWVWAIRPTTSGVLRLYFANLHKSERFCREIIYTFSQYPETVRYSYSGGSTCSETDAQKAVDCLCTGTYVGQMYIDLP